MASSASDTDAVVVEVDLVVPEVLVTVEASSLRGLLVEIVARLRRAEAKLAQREFEVRDLQEREANFGARLKELEDAFEEEINDGPAMAKSTTVVSRPTSAKSPRTPGLPSARSRRFLDWEVRMDELEKAVNHFDSKQKETGDLVELLRDESAKRGEQVRAFDAKLAILWDDTQKRWDKLLSKMTELEEVTASHTDDIASLKVRQQAAQNQLDLLDMGAFRRELDDVAKRLEDRLTGRMERLSAQTKQDLEQNRQDLEKAVGRCRAQLQDLAESAMENLRHSLGKKVLMLNPEEGLASGTTKHCISCFKDRSQSPVRGSIGTDGHLYQHPVKPEPIPEENSGSTRPQSPLVSTLLAVHERSSGRPLRPISARGRKPERYDTVLESYSRMLSRANERTLGKLVGMNQ